MYIELFSILQPFFLTFQSLVLRLVGLECTQDHCVFFLDNVITPTLNTPTVIFPTLITPTLNTSTVTNSLCNSGAFSNPNAVRGCPFNLKGAWFLSRSRKFFFVCSAIVFKDFQCGPTKYFLQKKILFHVDLIKMLSLISLFLRFPSYFPQNSG